VIPGWKQYLCSLDKIDKHFKREETERLKKYIENQNIGVKNIDYE
jgi:hypothetical protein